MRKSVSQNRHHNSLHGQRAIEISLSALDPLPPVTTGSFPVAQFKSSQKPFVAFGCVPNAAIHQKTEMTFNFQSIVKKRSFGY